VTFEALKSLSESVSQTDDFSTPFIPRDYNKFTYAFAFSKDSMGEGEVEADSAEELQPSD
jgi:hypothetical protein